MSNRENEASGWSPATLARTATDRGYLTIVTGSKPIGKQLFLTDGVPGKKRLADTGRYEAQTVRCQDLQALKVILQSLGPRQAIINGFVPGTEDLGSFRIIPERELRTITCTPVDQRRPRAIHLELADGPVLHVGRFKENFIHSRFLVFDRDIVEGMPEPLQTKTFAEWWTQMDTLDSQLRQCGYLKVPSASNRAVHTKSGKAVFDSLACHVFVQVPDAQADLIDDYYVNLVAHAWVMGLGFRKPVAGSETALRRYTIFDPSVAAVGRLLYDGPPSLGRGLKKLPLKTVYHEGSAADLTGFEPVSRAELKEKSGLSVTGKKGRLVLQADELRTDTVVECQTGNRLSVLDFLLGDEIHVRCQTPFRHSQSFAAFLSRYRNGVPFLHDVGPGTNYCLDAEAIFADIEQRFRGQGADALVDGQTMTLCVVLGLMDPGWVTKLKDMAKGCGINKTDFGRLHLNAEKIWSSKWSAHIEELDVLDSEPEDREVIWWKPARAAEICRLVRKNLGRKPSETLVFNQAGRPAELIRQARTKQEAAEERQASWTPRELTAITVAGKVESLIQFWARNVDGTISKISTPHEVRHRLAAEYPAGLPVLRGIVSHPIVTSEGEPVFRYGYDPVSGLFFADDGDYRQLANPASRADARQSYEWLREKLLADFPFAEPTDAAVAVSMVLTILARALLRTAPGFSISSPEYGTGKTTLAQTISAGIIGVPAATRSLPTDETEMQKVLLAERLAETEVMLFDNASSTVDHTSDAMAQFLTSPTMSGRILGASLMANVRTNATMILSGKNLRYQADLSSRMIPCRMMAPLGMTEPAGYSRPDPVQWAIERRSEVIFHGVRILNAFRLAGLPQADLVPCRFQHWSQLIRQALYWVTDLDVCTGMHEQVEADPESEGAYELLRAWRVVFGNRQLALRLIADLNDHRDAFPGTSDLFNELQSFCPKSMTQRNICMWSVDTRQLATRLKSIQDQEVGGLALRNLPDPDRSPKSSRSVKHWCVVSAEDNYAVGEPLRDLGRDNDDSDWEDDDEEWDEVEIE